MLKRDKNIKITTTTHELLKNYCEDNGLRMFAFVEKLIREGCKEKTNTVKIKKDIYGDELS